ncbi:hypothetical protein [Micromonospora radicis]|uniref:Uncharacterized protein n=1 Tax=Micromonospora radicis TaxID=1894971 RepID=A0A418MX57_9ACTN|nr:hypothetical protein [Micromonospora radicis]RIV39124.1 hypothetical protein D2L64_09645 [Micromonospora radicis]
MRFEGFDSPRDRRPREHSDPPAPPPIRDASVEDAVHRGIVAAMAARRVEVRSPRHHGPDDQPEPPALTFRTTGDRPLRITPHLRPVAEVAAPAHGRVRVAGVGRFFPADTVHAMNSTAVATADNCVLRSVDHYHVRRLSCSLDPVLTDGRPREALTQLLARPDDRVLLARFQATLAPLLAPEADPAQQRATIRLRPSYQSDVTGAHVVQQGDGSRMDLTNRYVVEEVRLPVVELLATDRGLVRDFVAAVRGDEPTATAGPRNAHGNGVVIMGDGAITDVVVHHPSTARPDDESAAPR